jgi:hypothetical protein
MRLRTPRSVAVCACVGVLSMAAGATAATIAVPAGGDLQAALNAAQPGDVVTLVPGSTYVGNFVLPNKGAIQDYITIRSAAPDAVLPPAGVRISPADAAQLPKIRSANSSSALRTATAANHWKLMFLEFPANQNGYGDIIALGAGDATQTQLAQVPYALVLDRVYVHGDPVSGQKRGISLHSSDTSVINSYVSDCKAVGQDSQALSGFNGPGNYLIENNYLEGATENVLFGGADPTIPNLVTTNITFRRNHLSKPLAWRDPIIATPAAVSATAVPGGGSLPAGSYAYKVSARVSAGQGNKANSTASAEVSATIAAGTSGGVTIAWTPVAGADDYVVYGRTSAGENMYWKTPNAYFTDSGAAGTSGTPAKATKWAVKNTFELKNAQDVVVEGNVMENLWVADQTGYPVVLTPRNQGGHAPWAVVQRVTVQYNLIRHAAGGVNILGTDDLAPSQRTNNITVRHNVFDDLTAATWGAGSRPLMVGDGPDVVVLDHNTIVSSDPHVLWLYGGSATAPTPVTNAIVTNNLAAHNNYGIGGSSFGYGLTAINAYMPGGIVSRNVLAGGSASRYPAGNYFPTVAAWQSGFVDFAGGDYRLAPSSPYLNAATDGTDLGADIARVNASAANALSGDDRLPPGEGHVQITTTTLPDGMLSQYYAQSIGCSGVPCVWQIVSSSLPEGVTFDPVAGAVLGVPSKVETGLVTLSAYDAAWPANIATATLTLTIAPPPLVISIPQAPTGQVGVGYQLSPTVSGVLGSASWSIGSGVLPSGLTLDPSTGSIAGSPDSWGTTTATLQVQDSWRIDRVASQPVTIAVAPAALQILTASLGAVGYLQPYQSQLAASGGSGSTTWSVSGGALPAGVTLDATGSVSGVPSTIGTFLVTVSAADANWPDNRSQASLAFTVSAPALAVTVSSPSSAQVGVAYQGLATAIGLVGTGSWSLASGALPPGVSLNAATGSFSGVPSAAGTFTAVIAVQDSFDLSRVASSAPIAIQVAASYAEVVLYAADATIVQGTWSRVADTTAAAGARLWNPDKGAAKLMSALAAPVNYFEMTFTVQAGVPYHLWMRGKADKNNWANDSVFVQFTDSVNAKGVAEFRIGTTSGTVYSVEDGLNAGVSGWGWNDDAYQGLAAPIYFATAGPQTIRVQVREDGLSVDQIVLSSVKYLTVAPGTMKNDTTILPR